MTERWQRELRALRTIDMPPSVRERIEAGPTGPAEPPRRPRVVAAVVAFAVFAAAGAFAWRALGPRERETPIPPVAAAPQVLVTLAESEEFDHYPVGTLTFGETSVDAAIGSFGWCDEDGSCGIADVSLPEFDEYVPIPVGSELVVRTDATRVRASIGDARYPFDDAVSIELTDRTGTLEGDLGRHGLVFDVRWEDGETYLEAPLYFPIELVDPAEPPAREPPVSPERYEANTTVLESREHGPELCLGGVAESYPPQCGGIPITNWDWDLVDGEESASGTTWGNAHVVGTYDGSTFTVSDAGPYEQPSPDSPDFTAPCPEPNGGWAAPDPDRATEDDRVAAAQAAEAEPDSAGIWVDYVVEPATDEVPVAPGGVILVAAFTGDLERHEAELRELWGGPLCVTRHEHTLRDLMRIQAELGSDAGVELGLQATWSAVDIVQNEVELGVVVAGDELRAAVEARYGPGVVRLMPALTPVVEDA